MSPRQKQAELTAAMHNPIKHMSIKEFSALRDQVGSTAVLGLLLIFLAGAVSFAGVAGVRLVMRADPPPVVTPACGDSRVEQLASAVEACIKQHSNPRKRTGCIAVVQRALCTEPADTAVLERIATIEHQQWTEWSKAVAGEVSPERRARWEKYWIPYDQLPEDVKELDREWARKVLAEVGPASDEGVRAELDLVKADLIEVMKVARRPMWRRHPDGHFPLE